MGNNNIALRYPEPLYARHGLVKSGEIERAARQKLRECFSGVETDWWIVNNAPRWKALRYYSTIYSSDYEKAKLDLEIKLRRKMTKHDYANANLYFPDEELQMFERLEWTCQHLMHLSRYMDLTEEDQENEIREASGLKPKHRTELQERLDNGWIIVHEPFSAVTRPSLVYSLVMMTISYIPDWIAAT